MRRMSVGTKPSLTLAYCLAMVRAFFFGQWNAQVVLGDSLAEILLSLIHFVAEAFTDLFFEGGDSRAKGGFFLFGDDLVNIRREFRELPGDRLQRFLLDDDKIIGFDQISEIALFGRTFLLLSIQGRNGEER